MISHNLSFIHILINVIWGIVFLLFNIAVSFSGLILLIAGISGEKDKKGILMILVGFILLSLMASWWIYNQSNDVPFEDFYKFIKYYKH